MQTRKIKRTIIRRKKIKIEKEKNWKHKKLQTVIHLTYYTIEDAVTDDKISH